jgi:hypothetical protein
LIALNDSTGEVVAGATVILGSELTEEATRQTDASGVAIFRDIDANRETVTVAAECMMPITFVDVPVESLTVYLEPILSTECTPEGDPTLTGGSQRSRATVTGEVLWPMASEFRRNGWANVPLPKSDAFKRVAYVMPLSSSPTTPFRLPPPAEAITPDADGTVGYEFKIDSGLGNLTLYALAGLENRDASPPLFLAYVMGLVRGVNALPSETTRDIYIEMTVPLDRALSMSARGPTPTSRGPDRIEGTAAVRVGNLGYAVFPASPQTSLLPGSGPLSFVGLPPLIGELRGATYVATATATTGLGATTPESVLGSVSTQRAEDLVRIEGFVEIPQLSDPTENDAWNGRMLSVASAPGGPEAALTLFEILGVGGRTRWTIVVPGEARGVALPDLAQLPGLGPRRGAVSVQVTRAAIADFDYGSMRYSALFARGWDAYASDVYQVNYLPE